MSAVIILNPAAGHGAAGKRWAALEPALLEALPGSVVRRTEAPGHAAVLALEAATEGATRVIAVGGDGTFSEVLQGLMAAPDETRKGVALGCVPAGSGCDIARHLRYPSDPKGLLAVLAGSNRRVLDAGKLESGGKSRWFINIAGFGLAGDVAARVARMGKPLGGTATYLAATVLELARARARAYRLIADGQDLSGRYHLVALANTAYTGGGMEIAPGAADDDGAFDLVTVSDRTRWTLLRNLPRIYSGTHLQVEGVALRRVKTLTAACDGPAPLNVDGEVSGSLPASFSLEPRAVTVLAP